MQNLRKLTFSGSLLLNAGLILIIVVLVGLLLWQNLTYHSYRDARPEGPLLVLSESRPVYDRVEGKVAFMLPQGTTLQESTPHGMATLGKSHVKEYILVIRSTDPIESDTKLFEDHGWMDHYRF